MKAIMNLKALKNTEEFQTFFHVRNTHLFQAHFILEETVTCNRKRMMIPFCRLVNAL
jgi:hypothetical protein